jgi:hypothetical protein
MGELEHFQWLSSFCALGNPINQVWRQRRTIVSSHHVDVLDMMTKVVKGVQFIVFLVPEAADAS